MDGFQTVGIAILSTLMLAAPAGAQQVGTYAGRSADGELVQFKVGPQNHSTTLAVREAAVLIDAKCEYSKLAAVGEVLYAVGAPIQNGVVSAERAVAPAFDIRIDLTFSADGQSATGSIRSILPGLDVRKRADERALYCVSPDQTMQVTLQKAGVRPPTPTGRVIYDWTRPAGGRP